MKKRTIIIPDIHGIVFMPKRILAKLQYNPEQDKVIFLGDYINRGQPNLETIQYIINLKKDNPDIITLKGNHEAWFLKFLKNPMDSTSKPFLSVFYLTNFRQTLREFYPNISSLCREIENTKINFSKDYPDILDFLENLDLYHEDKYFYYTHAGVHPLASTITDMEEVEYYEIDRNLYLTVPHQLDKKVVSGHTPAYTAREMIGIPNENNYAPYEDEHRIILDTGTIFGYALYAMTLDNETGEYEYINIGFNDCISDQLFLELAQKKEARLRLSFKVFKRLVDHYHLDILDASDLLEYFLSSTFSALVAYTDDNETVANIAKNLYTRRFKLLSP